MKRAIYIICVILMAAGFIFNGELFMLYLDNFQDSYYQASFGIVRTKNLDIDEEMKEDIRDAGRKYDVEYFLIDGKINANGSKRIWIYGTAEALKELRYIGIGMKRYHSLFVGDADVKLIEYEKVSDISTFEQIYLIGDESKKKDMDRFKAGLVNKYGGSFPKLLGNPMEIWINLFSVWFMICVLIVLLFIFKMIHMKKEGAVRILLGEDALSMFYKNAGMDAGILAVGFILVPLLLSGATNSWFKIWYIGIIFLCIILISFVVNLFMLRVNFRKDLSASRSGSGLLFANYAVKSVTVILSVCILSGSLIEIVYIFETWRQRDFFEAHPSWYHYNMFYVTGRGSEEVGKKDSMMNQDFYKRFQNNALRYVDLSEEFENMKPCILVNENAIREIAETNHSIEKLMNGMNTKGYYILYPKEASINTEDYEYIEMTFQTNFPLTAKQIASKEYSGKINVIAMMRDGGSNHNGIKMYRNPILLVNSSRQESSLEEAETSWWNETTMYDISKKELKEFVQEYNLENEHVERLNVLDLYRQNWAVLLRALRLTLALAIFLFLLEMTLILFIIRLEYRINAIEMAVRKVHGYTMFERNRRLITATLVSGGLSLLVALIAAAKMEIVSTAYLAGVGMVLLLIELIYIVMKARRIEAENIPRILKGEML